MATSPSVTIEYTLAAPASSSIPAPPAPEAFSVTLPPPKAAAPTPIPSDPLSNKAEVKSIAEPTGLYGPLLEAMQTARERVNAELTTWKEWEDSVGLGVGIGGPVKKSQAAEEDDDESEEDE